MKITAEVLRSHRACEEQVERFEKLFPNGAEVNEENTMLALKVGLDPYWVAATLLSRKAEEEYRKAVAPIREKHLEARRLTWKKCCETLSSAEEERREAIDLAWRRYYKTTDCSEEEYQEALNEAARKYIEVAGAARGELNEADNLIKQKRRKALSAVFVRLWRKYYTPHQTR